MSLLLLLFPFFFFACSLDYSQISVTDKMSEEIPDSVLHEFSYTKVENGTMAYQVEADKAEFFTAQKETRIENLSFREYDAFGVLTTEGRADTALLFTETENAQIKGNLNFYSAVEEATVTTDYLFWDNEHKVLTGEVDGRVVLSKDSGSHLDGIGFEADIRRRLVDFSGAVSGRYVSGDNEGSSTKHE